MKLYQIAQFHKKPSDRRAMEGVFLLGMLGVCLVAFRVYFMGNKPPEFAPSDNPASDSDSFLTRTLTFLLLPVLDVWMLLCPRILSFDWSMSAILLVESLSDYRNLFTVLFYTILVYLAYFTLSYINKHSKESKTFMNDNGHSNNVINASEHSTCRYRTYQAQRQTSFIGANLSDSSNNDVDGLIESPHSMDILIFSISLLVFPFILASNLFFYVGFVIAERVLYIPSMGFCLLVGHGCNNLYKQYENEKSGKEKLVVIATLLLIALNSGKTILRNRVWMSEEQLYTSGIAVNPPKASKIVHNNLVLPVTETRSVKIIADPYLHKKMNYLQFEESHLQI